MVAEVPLAMDFALATCFAFVEDTTDCVTGKRTVEPPDAPAGDTLQTPSLTAWIIPQPAGDECTLFARSVSAVELRVSVVDVLGTQVTPTVQFTVPAGTTAAKQIDTRGLRSGWYLLWLATDDASHAVRMYVHR